MTLLEEQQLKTEVKHIFDSGANSIRIIEMVKLFINNKKWYTENQIGDAYPKGYADARLGK